MSKNKFEYIGYGFVGSKKEESQVEVKSTKAYKALRAAFVDSIIIEVAPPSNSKRWKLRELITENLHNKNFVLVVPSIETLGGTYEDATSTYNIVIDSFNIIILNRPDLSTFTLEGKSLVSLNDLRAIEKLQADFACARMSTNGKGRKAIPLDEKFRKVFWAWQNYFIDTKDAIDLLGCSRGTLYSLAQEFMTSYTFNGIYYNEYENLEDFENKPVRGITLDDDTNEILLKIQRTLGFNWTFGGVNDVLSTIPSKKIKFGVRYDYLRLKLNFQYGRSGMAVATKTYSKGHEYVEQLREELKNI